MYRMLSGQDMKPSLGSIMVMSTLPLAASVRTAPRPPQPPPTTTTRGRELVATWLAQPITETATAAASPFQQGTALERADIFHATSFG
jgi:hypothetical protein